MNNFLKKITFSLIATISICNLHHASAQGIALSGVGAANRSFGGTAVASPLEPSGTLHWNPAGASALSNNEVALGLEFLWADTELSSGIPALGVNGSTDSDVGASTIPTASIVHREVGSDWTYGLGFFGVAGFRTNYSASLTNPILAPQAPVANGLGRIVSEAEISQVVPTVSYAFDHNLSLGFAPTLSIAQLQIDPLVLASPSPLGTYPSGIDSDQAYGAGFQVGVLYRNLDDFNLGASFKSPQWFESFRYNTQDASGLPRSETIEFDYPLIVSFGTAYTGWDRLILALDLHYFNYGSTKGFEQHGFDNTGAIAGLGWRSVWSVASGAQYKISDKITARLGYTYNENPIKDVDSIFNVASPLITQHLIGLGISYQITSILTLDLAYLQGLDNSISGPIINPALGGELEGTYVKSDVIATAVGLGITARY